MLSRSNTKRGLTPKGSLATNTLGSSRMLRLSYNTNENTPSNRRNVCRIPNKIYK